MTFTDFAEKFAYHDISAKAATFSVISQYKSFLMYRSKRLPEIWVNGS